MPQFQTRTDTFADEVRAKFPDQFYGKSDDEILQYFAEENPEKYKSLNFVGPPTRPSSAEQFAFSSAERLGYKGKETIAGITAAIKNNFPMGEQAKNLRAFQQRLDKRRAEQGLSVPEAPIVGGDEEQFQTQVILNKEEDRQRTLQDIDNMEALWVEGDKAIEKNEWLQGVKTWNEENPVEGFTAWFKPENMARGVGELMSSYIPIFASAGVGAVAGFAIAGPPGAVTGARVGGGAAGFVLEGGNHFRTAYETAIEEGYSKEEAWDIASNATLAYASVSSILESVAPTMGIKSLVKPKNFTKRVSDSTLGKAIQGQRPLISKIMKTPEKLTKFLSERMGKQFHKLGDYTKSFYDNKTVRDASYGIFTQLKRGLAWTGKKVLNPERYKVAFAEGMTEASQFLAEQAILDGYVKKEDIPDGWLWDQVTSQEFKDSFALGMYAGVMPVGSPSRTKTETKEIKTKTDKGKVIPYEWQNRVDVDPDNVADIKTETAAETKNIPFEKGTPKLAERFFGYTRRGKEATKSDVHGREVVIPSASLLEEFIHNGWESMNALEHVESHKVDDGASVNAVIDMLGEELLQSDKTNTINIGRVDGEVVRADVIGTLKGLLLNQENLKVTKTKAVGGQGQYESGAVNQIQFKEGMSVQDAQNIQAQFSNPAEAFGGVSTSDMLQKVAEQSADDADTQRENEASEYEMSQAPTPPEFGDKKGQIVNFYNRAYNKYREEGEEGLAGVGRRLLKANDADFRKFVEEAGFEDKLKHLKSGLVSASKASRQKALALFQKQADAEISQAEDLKMTRGNVEEVAEEKNNKANRSDPDKKSVTDVNKEKSSDYSDKQKADMIARQNLIMGDNKNPELDALNYGGTLEYHQSTEGFGIWSRLNKESPDAYKFVDGEYVPTPETTEIVNRLKKHFPEITGQALDKVITSEGVEVSGMAIGTLAQWATSNANIDAIPHEYFHIYLKTFADSPIIKEGLRRFIKTSKNINEAQETFALLIGEYYANRIKDKSLKKRIKMWVKQVWLYFKSKFGNMSRQDYLDLVGEQFYQGKRPSPRAMGRMTIYSEKETPKKVEYLSISKYARKGMDERILEKYAAALRAEMFYPTEDNIHETKKENTVDDDGKEQEISIQDNMKQDTGFFTKNIFFAKFGTYIPKTYLAADLYDLANEHDDVEDFKDAFLKDVVEKFGGVITEENQADVDKIITEEWQRNRSKIPIFAVKENFPSLESIRKELDDKTATISDVVRKTHINDTNGRFVMEMLWDGASMLGFDILSKENHSRPGVQNPTSYIENHMELQRKINNDGVRFMYMPIKHIQTHIAYKGGEFWKGTPEKLQLGATWVDTIDKQFASSYKNGSYPFLGLFISTKAGDNPHLIFSTVPGSWEGSMQSSVKKPVDVRGINKKFFEAELKAQIASNLMTPEQAREIYNDAEAKAKSKIFVWEKKTVTETVKGKKIKKEVNVKKSKQLGNLAYAQALGYHIRFQQTKASDYLTRGLKKGDNGLKRLHEIINRLKLDFGEGTVYYGSGDRRVMHVQTDKVMIKAPNKDGDMEFWDRKRPFGGEHDGDDGASFNGTKYFKALGEAGGHRIDEIKTSVRQLNMSSMHNYSDYIAFKHMDFTAFPDTEIYQVDEKTGKPFKEPFARLEKTNQGSEFVILQGKQKGQSFDTFSTSNEVKDSAGEFAKEWTVHTLPETATRVQIKSKTSKTAAHPVSGHEQIMIQALNDIPEGIEYLDALDEYIKEYVDKTLNKLMEFRNNPKKLRKHLHKDLKTGEVPTELQQWIELTPDGEALQLPHVVSQLVHRFNNEFIVGAMMKLRAAEGRGTKLWIKPKGSTEVNEGSFIASASNSTSVNIAEIEYKKSLGREEDAHIDYGTFHDKIKTLNEFLENNTVLELVHRQPIQGSTKVKTYALQQFLEGGHGNSIFLNPEDVFLVQDGDMDGDTVAVERPENDRLINAMHGLSKTSLWKGRDRLVNLKGFKKGKRSYSLTSAKDRGAYFRQNAEAMGSQGISVNAKTTFNTMAYKGLSFSDTSLPDGVSYIVRKPDDVVVMDYIEMDADALLANDGELYNMFIAQGDKIVAKIPTGKDKSLVWDEIPIDALYTTTGRTKTGKKSKAIKPEQVYTLHLQTTFENELSNVIQMSVDNAKEGLLYDIGFHKDFLLDRGFYRSDGKAIKPTVLKNFIKRVFSAFQYGATRRGRNYKTNKLGMSEMFEEFGRISSRYFNEGGLLKTDEEISNNIADEIMATWNDTMMVYSDSKKKSVKYNILNLSVIGKNLSPMEKLLSYPHLFMGEISEQDNLTLGATIMERNEELMEKPAHIDTMKEIDKLVKKDFAKIAKDPKKAAEVGQALDMLKVMAKEFDTLFENAKNKIGAAKAKGIRYDYNTDFTKFIEKWKPVTDGLSKMQHEMITYKFLSGTHHVNLKGKDTTKAFVLKLLPLDLMDKDVSRTYAIKFSKNLNRPFSEVKRYQTSAARYGFGWKRFTDAFKDDDGVTRICG